MELEIRDESFSDGRHVDRLSKLLEPLCSGGAIQLPSVGQFERRLRIPSY